MNRKFLFKNQTQNSEYSGIAFEEKSRKARYALKLALKRFLQLDIKRPFVSINSCQLYIMTAKYVLVFTFI